MVAVKSKRNARTKINNEEKERKVKTFGVLRAKTQAITKINQRG